jgi:hypothetical protein
VWGFASPDFLWLFGKWQYGLASNASPLSGDFPSTVVGLRGVFSAPASSQWNAV